MNQIDQSIKIEDTRKASHVCLANNKTSKKGLVVTREEVLRLYEKVNKK